MKRTLMLWMGIAIVSTMLMACDHIILPGDPVDPIDTTDTRPPVDTTDKNPVDTNNPGNPGGAPEITVTGPIYNGDPRVMGTVPPNSQLVMIWERADGKYYVWGIADINYRESRYAIRYTSVPPMDAYAEIVNGTIPIYAAGHLTLLEKETVRDGQVLSEQEMSELPVIGDAGNYALVYDTDNAPEQIGNGQRFLYRFGLGYTTAAYDVVPRVGNDYFPLPNVEIGVMFMTK